MLATSPAGAQVRRDTTARRDTTQRRPVTREDSARVRADSLQRDSTAKLQVQWAEPDSAMQELMSREGYTTTKFQGSRVEVRAKEKVIKLQGKAAVGRPDAVLVGDTIVYNDSLDLVTAIGAANGKDTNMVVLQDPTGAQDDMRAGRIEYEINTGRGKAFDVTTSVNQGQVWVVHGNVTAFQNDSSAAKKNKFYAKQGWITSCTETKCCPVAGKGAGRVTSTEP